MKNEFIATQNVTNLNDVCAELESDSSLIGPSLSMVTGPAGRGKTEAAKHYAATTEAIYLPPLNIRSATMILREITFELCKVRPMRSEQCLSMIGDEMNKLRRLIIVDEADLLPMQVLEMLRNINERFSCPVLLIGEQELKGKIASRRRLASRIRRRVEFEPLKQPDIMLFFKKALDLTLQSKVVANIHRFCQGDWRPVLTAAIAIEKALRASGLSDASEQLVDEIIKDLKGDAK